jgi:CheY-like chemotaxis protein
MKTRWTILVAEDNENDVLLLEHAFSRVKTEVSLNIVRDGEGVIEYLSGRNGFNNRTEFPFPQILLLDLKMPKVDGFNVLEWLRRNPPLHRMRVIVFSSSNHHPDVNRAYDLGASSFLQKPTAIHDMKSIVDCLKQWLEINQFPVLAELTCPTEVPSEDNECAT